MTDINKLLNTTAAGQIAKKLDAKDGNSDGQIKGSIWNEFVKDKGGKEISETGSISVVNAMKSITTYLVRQAKGSGKTADELAGDWSKAAGPDTPVTEDPETPAPTDPAAPAKPGKAAEPAPAKAIQKAGRGKVNKSAADADYGNIKFTLERETYYDIPKPTPPSKSAINKISANRKNAKQVANQIVQANKAFGADKTKANVENLKSKLALINKDNVAYVLQAIPNLVEVIDGVDFMGFGLDIDDVKEYVLKPMLQKADEYGIKVNGKKASEAYKNTDWTAASLASVTTQLSNEVRAKDKASFADYNNKVKEYNKKMEDYNDTVQNRNDKNNSLKEAQERFNKGCRILCDAANMNPKPEVQKDAEGYKFIKLASGEAIRVAYDSDGKIDGIYVNDKNGNTIVDLSESAPYANGSRKSSNYDFDKIRAVAEKIFGASEN